MHYKDFVLQLEKSGHLSKVQLSQAKEAAKYLEKNAAAGGIASYFRAVAPHLLTILGTTAATGALGYHFASKRHKEMQSGIQNSYKSLMGGHQDFAKKPKEFTQRFQELSIISPSIASNPDFAHKILRSRMKKGFDLDDIHRLAAIEHYSTNVSHPPHPSQVAATQAMTGLRDMINLLGPSAVTMAMQPKLEASLKAGVRSAAKPQADRSRAIEELQHQAAEQARSMDNMRKAMAIMLHESSGKDLKKQSSVEYLGDDVIGRMIADRYCMYKEAGMLGRMGKFLGSAASKSGKAMGDHFKMVAIPLALGMGWQVMRQLLKQRETSQMHRQADGVYSTLARKSDVIRENPLVAAQAFESLKSFAPSLATKPLIARTFVEHVVDRNSLGPETAQQLASTEESVRRLNELGSGGFLAGLKQPLEVFKFGYPPKGSGSHK